MHSCVSLFVRGSWAGYEHSSFCGQQFVLERGEYPYWESWSGSNAYHIERMMSFRPICSAVSFCPKSAASAFSPSIQNVKKKKKYLSHEMVSCVCKAQ